MWRSISSIIWWFPTKQQDYTYGHLEKSRIKEKIYATICVIIN
jgi:hypothetical protein